MSKDSNESPTPTTTSISSPLQHQSSTRTSSVSPTSLPPPTHYFHASNNTPFTNPITRPSSGSGTVITSSSYIPGTVIGGPPPQHLSASGLGIGIGPGPVGIGSGIGGNVAMAPSSVSLGGGKRNMPTPHPAESPAKKQSKWSPEEDALIIELRGRGLKWEDISKQLPGRSAISCRLHYQNYLERRSEWDEDRKNKLARLYERFKPEMWSKVAEEMAVPWRAAEAMHWNLGEHDMAKRAGVTPFSLTSTTIDAAPSTPGSSSSTGARGHSHTHSHGSSSSRFQHQRGTHSQSGNIPGSARSLAAASRRDRDSTPRTAPPLSPSDGIAIAGIVGGPGSSVVGGMGGVGMINAPSSLGPGQQQGRGQQLPGVAEMTTGISPYNTPAYSLNNTMGGGGGGVGVGNNMGGYGSPGPMLPPALAGGPPPGMIPTSAPGAYESKRRASPNMEQRECSRRRQ